MTFFINSGREKSGFNGLLDDVSFLADILVIIVPS